MSNADNTQVGGDHYKRLDVQPWTAMEAWMPREQFVGFLRGNAIKYLARAGSKGDFESDIGKALHYCEKLLAFVAAPKTDPVPAIEPTNNLPLLPIVVGGVYRRRDGSEDEIVKKDKTSPHFEGKSVYWYYRDGSCAGPRAYDLVERIR